MIQPLGGKYLQLISDIAKHAGVHRQTTYLLKNICLNLNVLDFCCKVKVRVANVN